MKNLRLSLALFLIPVAAIPCGAAQPENVPGSAETSATPSTFCRYIPERADDFAWENDLVAFRTYGPALSKSAENSGIDCWAKRVPYPIIDKWYRLDAEKKISYHTDHGEGCDFYHVGKTRGCGGTALWINGQMVLSNVYKEWKILESSREKSVFQLTYSYHVDGRKIDELKTITLELGQRLFKSDSVFTENGQPIPDLEVAIGVTTHNQRGTATMDREKGWISVWETYGKTGLGAGAIIDPRRLTGMEEIRSDKKDESHVIFTTRTDAEGRTVHHAGFAWTKAGDITSPESWTAYLGGYLAPKNTQ